MGGSELTQNSQFVVMCRGDRQPGGGTLSGSRSSLDLKQCCCRPGDQKLCVFVFPTFTPSCSAEKLTDESLTDRTRGFVGCGWFGSVQATLVF